MDSFLNRVNYKLLNLVNGVHNAKAHDESGSHRSRSFLKAYIECMKRVVTLWFVSNLVFMHNFHLVAKNAGRDSRRQLLIEAVQGKFLSEGETKITIIRENNRLRLTDHVCFLGWPPALPIPGIKHHHKINHIN